MTRTRAAAAWLAILLVSCAPASKPPPRPSPTPSTPSASPSPPASCPARVLATMSEDERIGQLLFVGLAANQLGAAERAAALDQHAGSFWYTELSNAPLSAVAEVSAQVQALAPVVGGERVRLFVAANQEGGQIDQFHGPGFAPIPSALEQGGYTPQRLEAESATWGRELMAAGVNLEVAPVVDTVPPGADSRNAPIGQLEREFGHDPATVSAHALAFMRGMRAAGEAVTVKHFPGLGRVAGNTDFAASVIDTETTPDDPYLEPFAQAIAAGPDMVMVSTAVYSRIDPDHPAAFSPAVMKLLRERYRFGGVIVADDLGAAAAVQSVPAGERATAFLAAGGDLITLKYAALAAPMAAALRARAAGDPAFARRVDDAAGRVLELKARHHLVC